MRVELKGRRRRSLFPFGIRYTLPLYSHRFQKVRTNERKHSADVAKVRVCRVMLTSTGTKDASSLGFRFRFASLFSRIHSFRNTKCSIIIYWHILFLTVMTHGKYTQMTSLQLIPIIKDQPQSIFLKKQLVTIITHKHILYILYTQIHI